MRPYITAVIASLALSCTDANPDFDQTGIGTADTATINAMTDGGIEGGPGLDASGDLDAVVGRPMADAELADAGSGSPDQAVADTGPLMDDATTLTDGAIASDQGVLQADMNAADGGGAIASDRDDDGFPEDIDCDDENAAVNPGAVELCDGFDNDCDDRIDESFSELGEACGVGGGACVAAGQLRCNDAGDALFCDAEPLVLADEVCDGNDNDCDGAVDEGVVGCCQPGVVRQCGVAVGVCQVGEQTCLDNNTFGRCIGSVEPVVESCNGFDDDCDGEVDEGALNPCGGCGPVAKDQCNGLDDDCDGAIDEGVTNPCGGCGLEPDEVCNDIDDDCDGRVDEGVVNACGACGPDPGEVCNGQDDDCDGEVDEALPDCVPCNGAQQEVCNGQDDDCDGAADEGVQNACGRCGPVPDEVCNDVDDDCDGRTDEGSLNACGRCGALPEELCNGQDDDCDGSTDEGVLNACGGCGPVPEELCNAIDDDCDGSVDEEVLNGCGACGPVPQETCNGVDDDCDGRADEMLVRQCGVEVGVCSPGEQVCRAGDWGLCEDSIQPSDEACDGLDNDCDGSTDEALIRDCGSDVGACQPGRQRCEGGWGECEGAITPVDEVCDGIDNDCDAETDEGLLNACGQCGDLAAERCNGLDEDCDGQVDERLDFCVAYLGAVDGPDGGLGLGRSLQVIGDLDGDGRDDIVAHGADNGRGIVVGVSGFLRRALWEQRGDGPLGASMALTGPDLNVAELLAGIPEGQNGAIRQIARDGSLGERFDGEDGFRLGDVTTSTPGLDGLVVAAPDFNFRTGGLVHVLGDEETYIGGQTPGQRLGERVYLVPDLDGDGLGDIIATARYLRGLRSERATVYFPSSNWQQRSNQLRAGDTDASFGESIVWGNFLGGDELLFVYGAPLYDSPALRDPGAIYLVDRQGQLITDALRGRDAGGRFGRRMATFRRADENQDRLLVGGGAMGRFEILRFANVGGVPTIIERDSYAPDAVGASFGFSIVSTRIGVDGRAFIYVGEPGAGDNGRVHVYSIR
ncbi:MAG: putative metal-binding motif-containing protein [Bradymonadia bacterium]